MPPCVRYPFFSLILVSLALGVKGQTPVGSTPLRQGGAVSAGMAGAQAGLQTHSGNLTQNPASMALLKQSEVSLSTGFLTAITTFLAETPSLYRDTTETPFSSPLMLSGILPIRSKNRPPRIALGLAAHSPYWATIRWPEGWKGRLISEEYAIRTLYLEPSVSVRITDKIAIGAGPVLGAGSWYDKRSLQVSGSQGQESFSEHTGTGGGLGYQIGVFFQPEPDFSLGCVWKSQMDLAIETGEARFTVPPSLETGYPTLGFTSEIQLPAQLSVGLGYNPDPRFLLALDLEWFGWKSISDAFVTYERQTLFVRNTTYDLNLRNVVGFRFGWEFRPNERLALRTGLGYLPTPTPADQLSPAFPDGNRIQVSLGGSWRFYRKIYFDQALWFEFTGERTGILSNSGFGGTYASTLTGLILGFRFGG